MALYDQPTEYLSGQNQDVTELRCQVRDLERRSLESEVGSLEKLLAEREEELAKQDLELAEFRPRETLSDNASRDLAAQLEERSRKLVETNALWANTDREARYGLFRHATPSSEPSWELLWRSRKMPRRASVLWRKGKNALEVQHFLLDANIKV